MDQGLIRPFKARYRVSAVHRLIKAIDKKKPIPTFSILDAMKILDMVWESLPRQVIINCFAKAGTLKDKQEAAIQDEVDPPKVLNEQFVKKRTRYLPCWYNFE